MKIIKRYANRKLYDTERSRYVTLEEIANMVRDGDDLKIIDQRTSKDLTNVTLAQIIFEEEKQARRILPLSALRGIIQTGGEFLQRLSQPVQQFREDTQRSMDRIMRPGEVIDEGRQAIREYAQSIQRGFDEMQGRIDERIKIAVDNLTHVPELETRLAVAEETIKTQQRQIEDLTRTVSRLHDAQNKPDGDRRFGHRITLLP